MPVITTFSAMMFIFKHTKDLVKYIEKERPADQGTGFVPTMGALHEGHLSLIGKAKEENRLVVCSIFVNPVQFNDANDFKLYPKTPEKDILLLEHAGCDVLFMPEVEEIYPPGEEMTEHYDLGYLETVLEGKYRPGHFQGVCRVMRRLLQTVAPNRLYLGQKDYQQCLVIKRLLSLMHFKTEAVICPTLREAGGLAMSSRNRRLSEQEKIKARGIFEALTFIKEHLEPGAKENVVSQAGDILKRNGVLADYVEIADMENLNTLEVWDGQTPAIALIAAFMGKVRLIDNMIIRS
ncbi:MAG: pantoate--beta-alanine ligase [Chitinophagaceae bacterium]|nr:pantoate--beta-alanine ligase [Chitinophagaceae bacterium]